MGIQKKKPEQVDNEEPPVVEKKPVGRPRKTRKERSEAQKRNDAVQAERFRKQHAERKTKANKPANEPIEEPAEAKPEPRRKIVYEVSSSDEEDSDDEYEQPLQRRRRRQPRQAVAPVQAGLIFT